MVGQGAGVGRDGDEAPPPPSSSSEDDGAPHSVVEGPGRTIVSPVAASAPSKKTDRGAAGAPPRRG